MRLKSRHWTIATGLRHWTGATEPAPLNRRHWTIANSMAATLATDQGASSKGTVMLSIHGVAAGADGFSNR